MHKKQTVKIVHNAQNADLKKNPLIFKKKLVYIEGVKDRKR